MSEYYEDVLIGKINHAIVGITKLEKDLAFTRKDNVTLKDKLKEAVERLKNIQYFMDYENQEYICSNCNSTKDMAHDPLCELNNFIRDNQGE